MSHERLGHDKSRHHRDAMREPLPCLTQARPHAQSLVWIEVLSCFQMRHAKVPCHANLPDALSKPSGCLEVLPRWDWETWGKHEHGRHVGNAWVQSFRDGAGVDPYTISMLA